MKKFFVKFILLIIVTSTIYSNDLVTVFGESIEKEAALLSNV